MRSRQHRQIDVFSGQRPQSAVQVAHRRQQHTVASLAQHQCVGQIVDVFRRAAEVQEVTDRIIKFDQPFTEKVLDRFDIVVRCRFDFLDASGILDREAVNEVIQALLDDGVERGQFGNTITVGEKLEPANFDENPITDEAVLTQTVAERVDLIGVAAIGRRERAQAVE